MQPPKVYSLDVPRECPDGGKQQRGPFPAQQVQRDGGQQRLGKHPGTDREGQATRGGSDARQCGRFLLQTKFHYHFGGRF